MKNATSLNPGTSPFTLSADFAWDPTAARPTAALDDDLVRKGLSTTAGGDFKLELLPAPTRVLKDAKGKQVSVASPVGVLDGAFHTIVCQRTATAVSITVDGVTRSKAAVLGSISNSSALTVGAKPDGTDQTHGYLRNVALVVG